MIKAITLGKYRVRKESHFILPYPRAAELSDDKFVASQIVDKAIHLAKLGIVRSSSGAMPLNLDDTPEPSISIDVRDLVEYERLIDHIMSELDVAREYSIKECMKIANSYQPYMDLAQRGGYPKGTGMLIANEIAKRFEIKL